VAPTNNAVAAVATTFKKFLFIPVSSKEEWFLKKVKKRY
jgi:hypothetical protein